MYCGKWRNILRITHLWNLWSGVVSGILSSGLFTGCSLNLGSTNHRKLWKLTSNWSAHGSGRVLGYRGESGSGRRAVGEKLYLILIKLDIGLDGLLIHWIISRSMVCFYMLYKSRCNTPSMQRITHSILSCKRSSSHVTGPCVRWRCSKSGGQIVGWWRWKV